MKTKCLTLLLVLVWISSVANDDKYRETMATNIGRVYSAKSIAELQEVTNIFARIGNAEKNKWEPFYYEAFGYVLIAIKETVPSQKDAYLDQAKTALARAMAIKADESEILALEGFIYMIRVAVDPATRGPQFSMLAMKSYDRAFELNPENPRTLGLYAQLQFGTARFFNSPPTEACATGHKALEKFDSVKPENPLAPAWGREMTVEFLKNCK